MTESALPNAGSGKRQQPLPAAIIRAATASDVPAIEALVREAYAPYTARIGRVPAPMMADYRQWVADGGVWVLSLGDEVAGLVILHRQADHVLVSNVAVGIAHQGQGLGRRLLDHAEAYARAEGFGELRLYTNEAMTENLAIYARMGWLEYDRVEQGGFRRVLMRRRILVADGDDAASA